MSKKTDSFDMLLACVYEQHISSLFIERLITDQKAGSLNLPRRANYIKWLQAFACSPF